MKTNLSIFQYWKCLEICSLLIESLLIARIQSQDSHTSQSQVQHSTFYAQNLLHYKLEFEVSSLEVKINITFHINHTHFYSEAYLLRKQDNGFEKYVANSLLH